MVPFSSGLSLINNRTITDSRKMKPASAMKLVDRPKLSTALTTMSGMMMVATPVPATAIPTERLKLFANHLLRTSDMMIIDPRP